MSSIPCPNKEIEDGFSGVHRDLLEGILCALQSKKYLEIGAAFGGTVQMAAQHCEKVVGVDIKNRISVELPKNVDLYFSLSDEFFSRNLACGEYKSTFDFIFLDGDHSLPQISHDFAEALCILNPGGVIALHDTIPPNAEHTSSKLCGEVYKLVAQISGRPNLQVFTFNIMFGLTLVSRMEPIKW